MNILDNRQTEGIIRCEAVSTCSQPPGLIGARESFGDVCTNSIELTSFSSRVPVTGLYMCCLGHAAKNTHAESTKTWVCVLEDTTRMLGLIDSSRYVPTRDTGIQHNTRVGVIVTPYPFHGDIVFKIGVRKCIQKGLNCAQTTPMVFSSVGCIVFWYGFEEYCVEPCCGSAIFHCRWRGYVVDVVINYV